MKTKRIILLTVLALVMGTTASAQDFRFGVKAGVSSNWMPGTWLDYGDRNVGNFGFYGGVAGTLDLSDSFFGQAELLFARKGVTTKNNILGKYSRNISYIQLPLLFGVKFGGDNGRVMVGPEFGYCVGNHVVSDVYNPASIGTVRPFNLAIALQVGCFITDNLSVDFKADMGLTKTMQNAIVKDTEDRGRNVSINLGLSWFFGD